MVSKERFSGKTILNYWRSNKGGMDSFDKGINRLKIPFFINIMLLISISQLSCIATTTNPSIESTTESTNTQQIIDYFMPQAPFGGLSKVKYTNVLNAGDNVIGSAQLIGEWELSGDWAHPWEFNVLGPSGEVLDHVDILYDMEHDPVHYFDFTASIQGVYTLEVIHISVFPRDMHIEIQPSGWEFDMHYKK